MGIRQLCVQQGICQIYSINYDGVIYYVLIISDVEVFSNPSYETVCTRMNSIHSSNPISQQVEMLRAKEEEHLLQRCEEMQLSISKLIAMGV